MLRKHVALLKKEYSRATLSELSAQALERLEQLPAFRHAGSFAIYHALPDEVQTAAFIDKWAAFKTIYLPVISGEDIQLHPFKGNHALKAGAFGIPEPIPEDRAGKASPDLIIVPGVAFDRLMNRMGRGKGYYDRLLIEPELRSVTKIGLCFSFLLLDELPVYPGDVKMNGVVTDREYLAR